MNDEVRRLEQEKALLIERYLSLQDRVDEYNRMIYQACCEIEVLNRKIEEAGKQSSRQGSRRTAVN